MPAGEEAASAAPDFTAYDVQGNGHKLSDFRGKPVILNFWASWCGPCKQEMPDLQKAYEEYGQQIHFVIVNLTDGTQDTKEKASAFIATSGYTFPVYYDQKLSGAAAYGVSSIPFTIFIDADGNMVAYYIGAMSERILQAGIHTLLPQTK